MALSTLSYSYTTGADCYNTHDGNIQVLLNSSAPPMTVNWVSPNLGSDTVSSGDSLLSSRLNLSAGTYYVEVNDVNNQSTPDVLEIVVQSYFIPVFSRIVNTTCGSADGLLTISLSAGTAPFSLDLYKDGSLFSQVTTNSISYSY